ncbi:MAG: MFS transporter [Deltaproteobacteria bacterium]|nr:MFS transporter [Deltaproteobacteria bacterium]
MKPLRKDQGTSIQLTPNSLESLTFRYHLAASFSNGITYGIYILHDFVARKTLGAPAWQLTIIVSLWPLANLFAVHWGQAMQGREKRPFLLGAGIFGRLILLASFLITSSEILIPFLLLVSAAASIIEPAQNAIFQSNYRTKHRGRLFGWAVSTQVGVATVVAFFAGKLLDQDPWLFQELFALAGITGFIQCYILASIPAEPRKRIEPDTTRRAVWQKLLQPFQDAVLILKKKNDFFIFESAFFVYGCGFILLLPVMPIYFADYLHSDYSQYGFTRGLIGQLGMVLLAPVLGMVLDRLHPWRFCSATFGFLLLFPVLLLFSTWSKENGLLWVMAAYGIFGLAMAGVQVAWSLGSIYFAGEEDSSMYQGVHVTLVGLRGLLAPWIGLASYQLGGPRAAFILAAFFFLTAMTLMRIGSARERKMHIRQ